VPLGATSPRPVLVVTHGAGGRPEAECAFFREIVKGQGFILCPRGYSLDPNLPPEQQGFFYPDHRALEREVRAAMAALPGAFAGYVDEHGAIYAGFSQGATMGALVIIRRPVLFERAIFIEGGVGESDEWTIAGARAFFEGGGKRVLLACGRPRCFAAAQRTAGYLEKAGLACRAVHGAGAGHTWGGAVGAAVIDAFPWLVEGDPRWRTAE
jgi:predicted esterase